MIENDFGYFRLRRIDGASLPAELEYGESRCVITDGDLVLRQGGNVEGDGIICIRLFGTALGITLKQQIYLEREPFDRVDGEHLTFPGGFRRRQAIPPHSVVRRAADRLEVSDLPPQATGQQPGRIFRQHQWSFLASDDQLPFSDAAAG
jgi:hypothetical protein